MPKSFSEIGITSTPIPVFALNDSAIACCFAKRAGCSSVVQKRISAIAVAADNPMDRADPIRKLLVILNLLIVIYTPFLLVKF